MLEADASARVWEWEGCGLAGPSGTRLIRLPKDKILAHLQQAGNELHFRDAFLIPDVTKNPASIFEGLARAGQDEAICYCGVPSEEFARQRGIFDLGLPPGYTMLVFMTRDLMITKWRICEEAEGLPGFPIDYATRFGRMLWP